MNIKEMFPDWKEMKPGSWSEHGTLITYNETHQIEIGLYREPDDNDEYAGTYTLQIFDDDDVIVCKTVEMKE